MAAGSRRSRGGGRGSRVRNLELVKEGQGGRSLCRRTRRMSATRLVRSGPEWAWAQGRTGAQCGGALAPLQRWHAKGKGRGATVGPPPPKGQLVK
jgi:hypothetical protein